MEDYKVGDALRLRGLSAEALHVVIAGPDILGCYCVMRPHNGSFRLVSPEDIIGAVKRYSFGGVDFVESGEIRQPENGEWFLDIGPGVKMPVFCANPSWYPNNRVILTPVNGG